MTNKRLITRAVSFTVALLLLVGLLPAGSLTALAEDVVLQLGEMTDVTPKGTATYTPAEDGWYQVYSKNGDDPFITAYDAQGTSIGYDDDSGEGRNFLLALFLKKGEAYTFELGDCLDSELTFQMGIFAIKPMEFNTSQSVSVTVPANEIVMMSFVSEDSGWYRIYSENGIDPRVQVFDADGEYLADDDDSGNDENFSVKVLLQKGEQYYLQLNTYSKSGDTFDLSVIPAIAAVSVEVKQEPYNTTVIQGYEYETYDLSGLELTFTLSDGTTEDWSYDEDNTIAGSGVEVDAQWEDDDTFGFLLTCDKASCFYVLETVPNPVASIEYTGEAIEIYANTNGYLDEEENYYYYYYNIPDEDYFTVTFTDGTSQTGSYWEDFGLGFLDIDSQQEETHWVVGEDNTITVTYFGAEAYIPVHILACPFTNITVNSVPARKYCFGDREWGFMNDDVYVLYPSDLEGLSFTATLQDGTTKTYGADEIDMDNWTIDGLDYDLSDVNITEPGQATVTINYIGYEFDYEIEVVPSPVASIEVVKDADKLEYIDGDYIYPILDGMQVKFTFTDGTEKTVTLNDKTISYEEEPFRYCFTVAGYDASIDYAWDSTDGEYYEIYCMGKTGRYTGFTFDYETYASNAELIEWNPGIDGSVVRLTYEDGTSMDLTLDVLQSTSYDDGSIYAWVKTEIGIYRCFVDWLYDEYDEPLGKCLVLGQYEILLDSMLGDLNGDQKIGADDALEVLKLVVGKSELTDEKEAVADVNGDGSVGAADALEILKNVVGKPSVLD